MGNDNAETVMSGRIDYTRAAPEVFKALLAMQKCVNDSSLEPALLELVKIRASQLNGCAYCLDMHCREALAKGEDARRINVLAAWHETTLFSPRERVALEWTEVLTCLSDTNVPDALYAEALDEFGERGLAELSLAVAMINVWNRFGVAFQPALP